MNETVSSTDTRIWKMLLKSPNIRALFEDTSPSWRYYTVQPKGRFREWWCCWTTQKQSNGKYASFVYEKKGSSRHLTRKVNHRTRTAAKDRAIKLYNQRKDQLN